MENLVIIGSGPAGLTAAIYAARANLNPLLLTGALPGGLLTQTTEVENFPGFPDGVDGFELMFKMQQQAEKFGTRVEMELVEKVDFSATESHKIFIAGGKIIEAKSVIIATGAQPRWLGLDSEERLKNHGVSACAVCDAAFFKDKEVVVIGGGDSAMEDALALTNFAAKVTVIHRRNELRASKIMAERAMSHEKINFLWNSQVIDVLGSDHVAGVKVKNTVDATEQTLSCEGVFVALGHIPATTLFKEYIDLDEHGFIKLVPGSSKTNFQGVFAAGDCADPVYRQAIHAAGMGCRAALDAERYLRQ